METSSTESYAKYLHLPPREAWKNPDRWLRPLNYDEKLTLPLDDRGFVKTDNAIDMVMDLFNPNYVFEYDPDNDETRDDTHHFYGEKEMYKTAVKELIAAEYPNPTIPMDFRNLATNMGHMPRQVHNTFHLKTHLIPMPDLELMDDYVRNYHLGKQILNKMVKAADKTLELHGLRAIRRKTVQQNPEIIGDSEIDRYGEEILGDLYNRHFGNMVSAFHELNAIPDTSGIIPNRPIRLERPNPHHILRIGKAASQKYINYVEQIRAS